MVEIYVAVIAGLFGIIVVVIPSYLQERERKRGRDHASPRLISALSGWWKGTVFQEEGADGVPLKYPISASFDVKKTSIDGSVQIEVDGPDGSLKVDLVLNGGIYRERFLRLGYINHEAHFHFGSLILEFPPTCISCVECLLGMGLLPTKLSREILRWKRTDFKKILCHVPFMSSWQSKYPPQITCN